MRMHCIVSYALYVHCAYRNVVGSRSLFLSCSHTSMLASGCTLHLAFRLSSVAPSSPRRHTHTNTHTHSPPHTPSTIYNHKHTLIHPHPPTHIPSLSYNITYLLWTPELFTDIASASRYFKYFTNIHMRGCTDSLSPSFSPPFSLFFTFPLCSQVIPGVKD